MKRPYVTRHGGKHEDRNRLFAEDVGGHERARSTNWRRRRRITMAGHYISHITHMWKVPMDSWLMNTHKHTLAYYLTIDEFCVMKCWNFKEPMKRIDLHSLLGYSWNESNQYLKASERIDENPLSLLFSPSISISLFLDFHFIPLYCTDWRNISLIELLHRVLRENRDSGRGWSPWRRMEP